MVTEMERFTVSDTSGIEQNLSVGVRPLNQDIGSSVWLSHHIGPKWAVLRFDWLVTWGCVWGRKGTNNCVRAGVTIFRAPFISQLALRARSPQQQKQKLRLFCTLIKCIGSYRC